MPTPWSELSTGAKVRRAHALMWWAVILPIVVVAIFFTAISTYRKASAIRDDHSIVTAQVSLDEEAEPSNRLAHFIYTYEVAGKKYQGKMVRPLAVADEVGSTVEIAYANFDPSQSMRPELLDSNADLGSELQSAALMSALGALLVGGFYLLLNFFLKLQFPPD